MCPGINGFTKCAPIADWVAHTWRCLLICVPRPLVASRTHRKKRDVMRHPSLGGWVPSLPTFGNEAGMCPGINGFTKCAPIADWVAHTWRCLLICVPRPPVPSPPQPKKREVMSQAEHTAGLQSHTDLVCRPRLDK